MTWRTVVIDSQSKLSYKNGYLIVRAEDISMVHLSEVAIVIINTTAISITSYLLSELVNRKVKVIFCDENNFYFSIHPL